ncbi:hypothetical protein, partial [Nocardia cyriacigeorgica]|uniref:hypothetical protein n=1 Tax=Nocardia cyriacigeorgica TaxID=135487 RepID=UPI002458853E
MRFERGCVPHGVPTETFRTPWPEWTEPEVGYFEYRRRYHVVPGGPQSADPQQPVAPADEATEPE